MEFVAAVLMVLLLFAALFIFAVISSSNVKKELAAARDVNGKISVEAYRYITF